MLSAARGRAARAAARALAGAVRGVEPDAPSLLAATVATPASTRPGFTRFFSATAVPAPAPAPPADAAVKKAYDDDDDGEGADLTPAEVVARLDRHIVGQPDAKRAVANALRARWRRHRVGSPLKEEIVPKNILMIGPTGCGKTEIARRLAKLANAPFVKVEATKFTEVGFHGRDVDQIIRDLVDNAVVTTRERMKRSLRGAVAAAVEERVLSALCGDAASDATRATFRELYRAGALDDRRITVDVPGGAGGGRGAGLDGPGGLAVQEMIVRVDKMLGGAGGRRGGERRELRVADARPLLEEAETERLVSPDAVARDAVAAAEADGIVFIDEIDKIVVNHDHRYGADASSEGVQRDLLPILEGSVVATKHGNVATDHILFIASGAFHACKPSDMLAELQGRLPIRVELKGLTTADFERILTEPDANMLRQHAALLATEGVDVTFTEDAVKEIAAVAAAANAALDNIGARRLHTVLERVLEEVSFDAPARAAEAAAATAAGGGGDGRAKVVVDAAFVRDRIGDLLERQDLSRFVL